MSHLTFNLEKKKKSRAHHCALIWKSCEAVSSELLTHALEVHKHTHRMKHYPDTHITTTMWNVMTAYCVGTLKEKKINKYTLRSEIHSRKLKCSYRKKNRAIAPHTQYGAFYYYYFQIYSCFFFIRVMNLSNCSLCKGLSITPPPPEMQECLHFSFPLSLVRLMGVLEDVRRLSVAVHASRRLCFVSLYRYNGVWSASVCLCVCVCCVSAQVLSTALRVLCG